MNCRGCGVEVEPSQLEVDQAVDAVLQASIDDAVKTGGVCPLCGHCKETPYTHRKPVLFILLVVCAVIGCALLISHFLSAQTERGKVADEAVRRAGRSQAAASVLGTPLVRSGAVTGTVKHDETGWTEADLTIGIRGPSGDAQLHVIGGRGTGEWSFTTAEILALPQRKRIDLVSGRVVEYDTAAYADTHTEAAAVPDYGQHLPSELAAVPSWDGRFPCVAAGGAAPPSLGNCAIPLQAAGPIERFEVDLRYGNFILRETDLSLNDVFSVPLTRTFNTADWIAPHPAHAFGMHGNHPFDVAPLGTRNPYTQMYVVLEDGSWLQYDRISKGTGYADAVFLHTETSTSFYKSIIRWNGHGWTLTKPEGSVLHFPESYAARNLAQGALTDIMDRDGNKLELRRDARRNLREIRTPHGHFIKLDYDDQDRIVRAEDDRGHWATYRYTAQGSLADVSRSDGSERHFSFEDGQMTLVRDERDRILVRNYYDRGVVVRQDFGNGQSFSYNYHRKARTLYADAVEVTSPTGMVTLQTAASVPALIRNTH